MSVFSKTVFRESAAEIERLPADGGREVAFVGRSNAGKSSTINALTGIGRLAFVSKQPGRTQLINLFEVTPGHRIVDLPGYGFARVSKAVSAHWHRLIDAYLRTRPQLKRVCLLIDSRHPPHDSDRLMMEILDRAAVSYVIVLTKMDKLNATERQRAINDAIELRQHHVTIHPELFATSSETAEGLPELRALLARLAKPADKGYKPANREMR
jgi:GTP-binding protein